MELIWNICIHIGPWLHNNIHRVHQCCIDRASPNVTLTCVTYVDLRSAGGDRICMNMNRGSFEGVHDKDIQKFGIPYWRRMLQ